MSDYKYPDLMPGETFSAYVDRAGKAYVKWRMTEQGLSKEACLAEYKAFVESERARLDSNIKRLLRSHKRDPREEYLIPTIFYNYTTLVPDDYEVTEDNITDAGKRLNALLAEHKALDAERNRYLRLPPNEQRRYVLTTLLYAPIDPKVVEYQNRVYGEMEVPTWDDILTKRHEAGDNLLKHFLRDEEIRALSEYVEKVEAEHKRAMEARRDCATACIELLIDKITSVKRHIHYEKKAVLANENSDESVIKLRLRDEGLRLRAERNRILAEKAARLAEQRAEKNRILAEKAERLAYERAQRRDLDRRREERIAAEKAEKRRLAQQREATKAEYNRLVAGQIEAKRLKKLKQIEQIEQQIAQLEKELKINR